MKLPDTKRKKALIIVDLQPAFLRPHNSHIIKNIQTLIEAVPYSAYVTAVFHAEEGSIWHLQQDWLCPQDDETRIIPEIRKLLDAHETLDVTKETRSVFNGDKEVDAYLKQKGIEEVHLVGTETNDCVLATAMSTFDAGYFTYVLEECCEAATPGRHALGVKLLRQQGMSNNRCLAHTRDLELPR